jgi:hypothetical protein
MQACSFFADPIPGYKDTDAQYDVPDADLGHIDDTDSDGQDTPTDMDAMTDAVDMTTDTNETPDTDLDLIDDTDSDGQDTPTDIDAMTDAVDMTTDTDPEQDSDNDATELDTGESCISCDQEVQSNNICNEAMTAFTSCQQTEGDIYCLLTTLCENDCIQPRDGSNAYCGIKCEPESARYCLPDTFGCLSDTIMTTCGDDNCANSIPCNSGEFCRDGLGCVTD